MRCLRIIWREAIWPGIALAIVAGCVWLVCGAITDQMVQEVEINRYDSP
jgi:hypothetical protein